MKAKLTNLTGANREKCVVIEVIGRAVDKDAVLKAASRIKTANKQEAVIVTATAAEQVWTI